MTSLNLPAYQHRYGRRKPRAVHLPAPRLPWLPHWRVMVLAVMVGLSLGVWLKVRAHAPVPAWQFVPVQFKNLPVGLRP